jgi:hypothetical protein
MTCAAVASAHHAKKHHKKHHAGAASDLPCTSYISTADITGLESGAAMEPYLTGQGKAAETWPAGTDNSLWSSGTSSTIAGSECAWINDGGPGLGDDDSLQAWAAVGYGESEKNWNEMWAHGGPPFTEQEGTVQSTTKVTLEQGTQGYVQTIDIWAQTGEAYFTPPKYLYAVTVLTKHHNLLLVAPETAALASVEAEVTHVLTAYPSL